MAGRSAKLSSGITLLFLTLVVGGCAGGPSGPGMALSSGGSCKAIKKQLSRYEARGVHLKADAAARGKKYSGKQMADVRRYNDLLNSYLGNQCHV